MVVVPGGNFLMGSPASDTARFDDEGPQHPVTIANFVVGQTPVTRAEYAAFVRATHRPDPPDCAAMDDNGDWKKQPGFNWHNPGFPQANDHPAVCVSWYDAKDYAAWLSGRTGKRYGLLSEAEFEYAVRGGTTTPLYWGDGAGVICSHANGFDLAARRAHPTWPSADCDDGYANTAPVTAYPRNPFGLYSIAGNAFQWVEDCYVDGYAGAPADGAARTDGDCVARVIRGGSWLNSARGLRTTQRDRDRPQDRYSNIAIRVARAP